MISNFKDEVKKLIGDTIDLFLKKKNSKRISKRVRRGRAASIASEFEERFAIFLENILPPEFSIFIDYPMSYRISNVKRTKTFYPDIALIKDHILVGIIELKIDLGWLRKDWTRKQKSDFKNLRDVKHVTYKAADRANKKNSAKLKIGNNLNRMVVLLTDENDHDRLEVFKEKENCFILCSGVHLNDPKITEKTKKQTIQSISSNKENRKNWSALSEYLDANFIPPDSERNL